MKRLISFLLVAALAAGAAFAQVSEGISIDASGTAAFSPLIIQGLEYNAGKQNDDFETKVFAGTGEPWGNSAYVDVNIKGETDYVGFGLGLKANSRGTYGLSSLGAHVWLKPFGSDLLKITAGNFKEDALRGKVGSVNGGFEYFSMTGIGIFGSEEDQIFTRFRTGKEYTLDRNVGHGFMLSSRPIDPLFIGVKMDTDGLWNDGDNADLSNFTAPSARSSTWGRHVYRGMQIGAGYEIDGVGLLRAQLVGGYAFKIKDTAAREYINGLPEFDDQGNFANWGGRDNANDARIEAAFAFTGSENLVLDIGVKVWMPVTVESYDSQGNWGGNRDYEYWNGINASVGATFESGALGIAARIDAGFLGHYGDPDANDWAREDPFSLNFRLTPTYNLDFAKVGVDVGLGFSTESKDRDPGPGLSAQKDDMLLFGLGAFIQKDFGGNGSIKAGLAYSFVPTINGDLNGYDKLSIPVVMEFSF